MSFNCNKCGACCKFIKFVIPELAKEDGSCKHLDENNLCGIYEDRPFLCRVDAVYDKHYSKILDVKEYYKLTDKICEKMREVI